MRIQPNGTVPTLTNGQIVKDDSRDIILYLDELAPDGKIVQELRINLPKLQ